MNIIIYWFGAFGEEGGVRTFTTEYAAQAFELECDAKGLRHERA